MSRTVILYVYLFIDSLGIGINAAQQFIQGNVLRKRFARILIRRGAS